MDVVGDGALERTAEANSAAMAAGDFKSNNVAIAPFIRPRKAIPAGWADNRAAGFFGNVGDPGRCGSTRGCHHGFGILPRRDVDNGARSRQSTGVGNCRPWMMLRTIVGIRATGRNVTVRHFGRRSRLACSYLPQ